MKRKKITSILEYSVRNKMLIGILAVSLIGAGGVFLSSHSNLSNNSMKTNKTMLAVALNNDGNKACVINGNDNLVLYTSASNSNIKSYISAGEMLTINSYSNGYYNVSVQETGATGYISSSNIQKIVSGVGDNLTSLSGTGYITNVSTMVNLRAEATMNSTVLSKLKNNTSVTLLYKQGDWYKVVANGTTGYIYGEYMAMANATSNSLSSSTTPISSNTTKTAGTINSNNSSNTSTKAKLSNNGIKTTKSINSTNGTTSNTGNLINQSKTIGYINQPEYDKTAGIYEEPSGLTTIEATLQSGTKIIILGSESNGWYKIEYGNTNIGYIPAKYVSFNKPSAENSSSSSSSTTGTTTKPTSSIGASPSGSSSALSQLKEQYTNELDKINEQANIMSKPLYSQSISETAMDEITYNVYTLWNNEVNKIYNQLEQSLPSYEVAKLQQNQGNWRAYENKAIENAGAKYENGSIVPLIENSEGITLAKQRCYDLINDYM